MPLEIYAISDLHLGQASPGHFTSKWAEKGYHERLAEQWDARVPDDALVLIPGDFSWSRDPERLREDFAWINQRKGRIKVLCPGNHDYTVWDSQQQISRFLEDFETLVPVMGDAVRIPNPDNPTGYGLVIAAACGTHSPGDDYFDSNSGVSAARLEPEAVRLVRELGRLRQALQQAKQLRRPGDELVVMLHYPPFANGQMPGPYCRMVEQAKTRLCVYGHLHHPRQWGAARQGRYRSDRHSKTGPLGIYSYKPEVEYRLVAADFLDFRPTRIGRLEKYRLAIGELERRISFVWEDNDAPRTPNTYPIGFAARTSPPADTNRPAPSANTSRQRNARQERDTHSATTAHRRNGSTDWRAQLADVAPVLANHLLKTLRELRRFG